MTLLFNGWTQRYREIAPLFSVANSKARVKGITHYQGGVRSDVGSEKYAKNL